MDSLLLIVTAKMVADTGLFRRGNIYKLGLTYSLICPLIFVLNLVFDHLISIPPFFGCFQPLCGKGPAVFQYSLVVYQSSNDFPNIRDIAH